MIDLPDVPSVGPDNENTKYYRENELNSLVKNRKLYKSFKIFHLNVRSLNKNYNSLLVLLSNIKFEFDIIILSEIWSTNIDIVKNEFPSYSFSYILPTNSKIGGIAILTLKTIKIENIDIEDKYDNIESVVIQIIINNIKTTIIGVYRHPTNDYTSMIALIETFTKRFKNVIIVGDININFLNEDKKTSEYLDKLLKNQIINHINKPTRITDHSSTLIDHIYTKGNNINKLNIVGGILKNDISDHYAEFILIDKIKVQHNDRPMIRIFSERNKIKYKELLNENNWEELINVNDISISCSNVVKQIQLCYNAAFPKIRQSIKKSKDKPWITTSLKECSKKKNKLYVKYKNTKNKEDDNVYKKYKKIFEKALKNAEDNYYKIKISECHKNSKKIWKILNHLFKPSKTKTDIPYLFYENSKVDDDQIISNIFNDIFCNIGKN